MSEIYGEDAGEMNSRRRLFPGSKRHWPDQALIFGFAPTLLSPFWLRLSRLRKKVQLLLRLA